VIVRLVIEHAEGKEWREGRMDVITQGRDTGEGRKK
jgi:hypothetical protein